MPAPQSIQHTAASAADAIKTVNDLELSCERDEADWTAKITSLRQVTIEGKNASAATYEEVDERVGHLTFTTYSDDINAHSRIAQHSAQHETFLFKGAGFVAMRQ
jgi:homoserine acetyltransferase